MELIDRYIYAVTKRLPDKMKMEVDKELRANISDMLLDDYSDENIEKILYSLGNPAELAEKYQGEPKYLIGPKFYSNYLYVLKIVLIVCLCAAPIAAFISFVKDNNSISFPIIGELILEIFRTMLSAVFQGFTSVTIIYAIFSRINSPYMRWPFTGKDWTIQDLEAAPKLQGKKIELSDPIFSIIFSIIGMLILCFNSHIIGWHTFENDIWNIIPLFHDNILNIYLPFLFLLILFEMTVSILKLIYRSWTKKLAILNAVNNLFSTIFAFAFLTNQTLFHEDFKAVFAENISVDINQLNHSWQQGTIVIFLVILLINIYESVRPFFKLKIDK